MTIRAITAVLTIAGTTFLVGCDERRVDAAWRIAGKLAAWASHINAARSTLKGDAP